MSRWHIKKGGTRRKAIKRRVWARLHGEAEAVQCHWCPKLLTFAEATMDHEPPISDGGAEEDVVFACLECNDARNRAQQKRSNRRAYRSRKAARDAP